MVDAFPYQQAQMPDPGTRRGASPPTRGSAPRPSGSRSTLWASQCSMHASMPGACRSVMDETVTAAAFTGAMG